jgi:hypothetical protein
MAFKIRFITHSGIGNNFHIQKTFTKTNLLFEIDKRPSVNAAHFSLEYNVIGKKYYAQDHRASIN